MHHKFSVIVIVFCDAIFSFIDFNHFDIKKFEFCLTPRVNTTIVGRSESKLKDVLSAASKATGIEGLEKNIPLVVCDVADPDSLVQMAKTTRLVTITLTLS